jgi:hypothetical protein
MSLLRSACASRGLLAARSAGDPRGDRPFAGFSGDVAALCHIVAVNVITSSLRHFI